MGRRELEKLPIKEADYKDFLGVPNLSPPPGFNALEAIRFCPTLEFNGMEEVIGRRLKNSYSIEAFAKITCRLVPNRISVMSEKKFARRSKPPAQIQFA